jgi:hypothetical protein
MRSPREWVRLNLLARTPLTAWRRQDPLVMLARGPFRIDPRYYSPLGSAVLWSLAVGIEAVARGGGSWRVYLVVLAPEPLVIVSCS